MPYKEHPLFTDPSGDYKIWRYINLDKFQSILERKALFFCRADKFVDPFEGSLPRREFEHHLKELQPRTVQALSIYNRKLTALTLINSWHYNDVESDAMWQLYLKTNRGIAIQSNFQRLKESFKNTPEEIHIGRVRYLDYDNDIFYDREEFPHIAFNAYIPFIHKRKHFQHEQEYRATTEVEGTKNFKYDWASEDFENGKHIGVDPTQLIEQVVLPPKSDEAFELEVKELISRLGFEFSVQKSVMENEPIF